MIVLTDDTGMRGDMVLDDAKRRAAELTPPRRKACTHALASREVLNTAVA